VRDQFIALKRQYKFHSVDDKEFVSGLQKAADWLVARKVLPEPVTVSDHLAKL
jgi:sulfonate transport system substrate-binding protein